MKKILISTLICLITASAAICAGISDKQDSSDYSEKSGSLYRNNTPVPEPETLGIGIFRSSDAGSPGGRPGNGQGIGQEEAPLGDGLYVLLACCATFVIIKCISAGGGKKF